MIRQTAVHAILHHVKHPYQRYFAWLLQGLKSDIGPLLWLLVELYHPCSPSNLVCFSLICLCPWSLKLQTLTRFCLRFWHLSPRLDPKVILISSSSKVLPSLEVSVAVKGDTAIVCWCIKSLAVVHWSLCSNYPDLLFHALFQSVNPSFLQSSRLD